MVQPVAPDPPSLMEKEKVLIVCTGNSARSQMAEGLLRHEGGNRFEVFSAGTQPGYVRPEAIAVMRELGMDISSQRSKSTEEFAGQQFAYVITVCDHANETCPVFPFTRMRLHWPFPDPASVEGSEAERQSGFRSVRDQIHRRVRLFLNETTT